MSYREDTGPDMYRADPIGMSIAVAAVEAAPPDSTEGKRAAIVVSPRWFHRAIAALGEPEPVFEPVAEGES